jgi:hypothetical protein
LRRSIAKMPPDCSSDRTANATPDLSFPPPDREF